MREKKRNVPRDTVERNRSRAAASRKGWRSRKLQKAAIVKVERPALADPRFDVAPKILQTARDMEQVRRFVMRCLNVDYQKLSPAILQEITRIRDSANGREMTKSEKGVLEDLRNRLTDLEVDWGTIPGSKPFLKQPGAEKFMLWLNIKPKYHKTIAELGDGHMEVVCYVTFHSKTTDKEVFEGPEASCSTMETNYRYIWGEAGYLPKDDEVQRGYQTKMGQWRWVDDWQKGKKVGRKKVWYIRVDNPNIYNERNKVRQIGQKRGLVKGCRNLGAMSELFVAGPDEWDVPPEEDEPQADSPGVEKDYTEGGRKVYHDGVAPSGREQSREREMRQQQDKPVEPDTVTMETSKARGTWCERHQSDFGRCPADEHSDAENEAMAVAEESAKQGEKASQPSPPEKASQAPQESQQPGNTELPQVDLSGIWPRTKSQPMSGTSPDAPTRPSAGTGGSRNATSQRRKSTAAAPEPVLLAGKLERVNHVTTTSGKVMAYVTIKGVKRKYDLSSWDKDINEYLENGKGQEVQVYVVVKGKYRNLVGLKWIGKQEFTEGKTPVIQQKDR
jgi:hypothetical protein